jgi:hypothetical protein
MPVVGSCDDNCIQGLVLEQTTEVLVKGNLGSKGFPHFWDSPTKLFSDSGVNPCVISKEIRFVDIAKGSDLTVRKPHESLHELCASVAHSDKSKTNAIVSSNYFASKAGADSSDDATSQETAPGKLSVHIHWFLL